MVRSPRPELYVRRGKRQVSECAGVHAAVAAAGAGSGSGGEEAAEAAPGALLYDEDGAVHAGSGGEIGRRRAAKRRRIDEGGAFTAGGALAPVAAAAMSALGAARAAAVGLYALLAGGGARAAGAAGTDNEQAGTNGGAGGDAADRGASAGTNGAEPLSRWHAGLSDAERIARDAARDAERDEAAAKAAPSDPVLAATAAASSKAQRIAEHNVRVAQAQLQKYMRLEAAKTAKKNAIAQKDRAAAKRALREGKDPETTKDVMSVFKRGEKRGDHDGPKDFAADLKEIRARTKGMYDIISEPRRCARSKLITLVWDASRCRAEATSSKGKWLTSMGYSAGGRTWLRIEEALFLVENAVAVMFVGDWLMSVQDVYALMIGLGFKLRWYHAFAHLIKHGYIVRRAQIADALEGPPSEVPRADARPAAGIGCEADNAATETDDAQARQQMPPPARQDASGAPLAVPPALPPEDWMHALEVPAPPACGRRPADRTWWPRVLGRGGARVEYHPWVTCAHADADTAAGVKAVAGARASPGDGARSLRWPRSWAGQRGVLERELHGGVQAVGAPSASSDHLKPVGAVRTIAATYRDSGFTESESEALARFPILFDVHLPNAQFSKRNSPAPAFRLAIIGGCAPCPAALRAWRARCPRGFDADVKVCFVNADAVMIFDAWPTQLLAPTMPPLDDPEEEEKKRRKEHEARQKARKEERRAQREAKKAAKKEAAEAKAAGAEIAKTAAGGDCAGLEATRVAAGGADACAQTRADDTGGTEAAKAVAGAQPEARQGRQQDKEPAQPRERPCQGHGQQKAERPAREGPSVSGEEAAPLGDAALVDGFFVEGDPVAAGGSGGSGSPACNEAVGEAAAVPMKEGSADVEGGGCSPGSARQRNAEAGTSEQVALARPEYAEVAATHEHLVDQLHEEAAEVEPMLDGALEDGGEAGMEVDARAGDPGTDTTVVASFESGGAP